MPLEQRGDFPPCQHDGSWRGRKARELAQLQALSGTTRYRNTRALSAGFCVLPHAGESAYSFPYSKTDPKPSGNDPVEQVYVDKELGNEAFTYILRSGEEGSVHIEQVLEYHEDPGYLADLLTYKLSVEAQKRAERSELSRRRLAKQLNTSVPQLYRLLDPSNTNKSMRQLIALLHVLDCDVDVVLKKRKPNKSLQRTVVSVTHFAKGKVRATDARR